MKQNVFEVLREHHVSNGCFKDVQSTFDKCDLPFKGLHSAHLHINQFSLHCKYTYYNNARVSSPTVIYKMVICCPCMIAVNWQTVTAQVRKEGKGGGLRPCRVDSAIEAYRDALIDTYIYIFLLKLTLHNIVKVDFSCCYSRITAEVCKLVQ